MTFRNTLTTASAIPILLFALSGSAVADDTDLALEPAINGEVSANGLYAFARDDASTELEPAINGDVSASGRFASQAEEDAYTRERGPISNL